ncbi:MAG: LPS-assembly protein LptD [marine bacterium B5-7]|nr:MAG: LPS-assembly protein LptD [marine bacterium B5-7]
MKCCHIIAITFGLTLAISGVAKQTDLDAPTPKQILSPFPIQKQLYPLSHKMLIQTLGWVPDTQAHDCCKGYYQEPFFELKGQTLKPLDESTTHIQAKTSRFVQHGISTLFGHVFITQPGRILKAKKAYVYQDPTTGTLQTAELFDHVSIREPGKYIVGSRAHIYFEKNSASIDQATYRLAPSNGDGSIKQAKRVGDQQHIRSLNAWGRAIRLEQVKPGLLKLHHASYSTCPPDSHTWHVKGNTIDLNRETGRGELYNGALYVHQLPIMYLPYFNFPIDKRRKSGFLYPSYSYNNDSGVMISVPFYWNLAPNYDMLITPKFMGHRGIQLQDMFRYLTKHNSGHMYGEFLPGDAVFKRFRDKATSDEYPGRTADFSRLENSSSNRGIFSVHDDSHWGKHLRTELTYNYISDDYYFEDFDQIPGLGTSVSTAQFDRRFNANYESAYWSLSGLLQTYQTLHPVNQSPIASPYSQMPAISLTTHAPTIFGINPSLQAQYTDFTHTRTPGQSQVVNGERAHILPGLSVPLHWASGFIKPRIQADVVNYTLKDQATEQAKHPFRALPIFDVDSGLYFDKQTNLFHHHYTQTLEPQAYYAFVPYKNQQDIPLFDSSEPALTVPQMLTYNRFSGIDRLADTNRLSLAMTSRFIDNQTGAEQFVFQLGQMIYFSNRRVSLSGNDLTDLSSTDPYSPLVGNFQYRLNHDWQLKGNAAFSYHHDTPISQGAQFHYQTDNQHIFNIGYSFTQLVSPVQVGGMDINRGSQIMGANPKELIASMYWPLPLPHWYTFGFADYDVGNKHAMGTLYGIEYDSCCWGLRLLNSRTFHFLNAQSDQNIYNTTTILQVVLKGLGSISNSGTSDLLAGNISGFHDSYQQGAF